MGCEEIGVSWKKKKVQTECHAGSQACTEGRLEACRRRSGVELRGEVKGKAGGRVLAAGSPGVGD